MPVLHIAKLGDLRDKVGQEVVVSEWLEVSQARIDAFAECTEDRQWIHIDPERARRESPFGGSIAHGFLTLSLLSKLLTESIRFATARMGVNYGFNRVRFTAPVPAGSRVRGRFVLAQLEDIEDGGQITGVQMTWLVTIEREGVDKPCLVAEWVTRRYQ
jgi:acyl dehydratase